MKLLWLALALLPVVAHAAGTLSCPDLSAAVQVATCDCATGAHSSTALAGRRFRERFDAPV
jgi:hypothetical protein